MDIPPSVPFTIDNMYAGLAVVQGMLRFEDGALVLEFRVHDNVVNMLQSDVKELRLPLNEVEQLEFRNGFFGFGSSLRIRARKIATLKDVPGSEGAEVKLLLARGNRGKARECASLVNLEITERLLLRQPDGNGTAP